MEEGFVFLPTTKLKKTLLPSVSYSIYISPRKTTIPTMPFTVLELTAFWTNPDQMGDFGPHSEPDGVGVIGGTC